MMTPNQLQLITAAVDGELSITEAHAFRCLLDGSLEARTLYAKLQADSSRVRTLAHVPTPAGLRARIMARVAAQPLAVPAPAMVPFRKRLAAWAPVAVAASVLLCVTAGSFAFFRGNGADSAARHDSSKLPTATNWANVLPADHNRTPSAPPPITGPESDAVAHDVQPVPLIPSPRAVPNIPKAVAIAPLPRPVTPGLVGSPLWPKLPPLDFVQVRVPFLHTVAELDRDDARQELLEELGHDPAYRFDLFVRDPARGVDVFQRAAKAVGIKVFADAATLDRLKKRHAAAVVIYTESLTAVELTALFAQVSVQDMKFSPRVCDALHAAPVARFDELELQKILGTNPGLFKRPRAAEKPGAGQGGPKSVSDETIDMLVKSITAPAAKPGEKTAVLLTWQTTHPNIPRTIPATSKELKQFFAKRGDRKPKAIPAIIVIRHAG